MNESLSEIKARTTETSNLGFQLPHLNLLDSSPLAPFAAQFNGVPVNMTINISIPMERTQKYSTVISMYHSSGARARVYINLERQAMNYLGRTDIENLDPGNKKATILKGAGVKLWEESPKIMQQYADALDNVVIHRVIKRPSFGLTPQDWDGIFLPLLHKYGYKLTEEGNWEKTYSPQK